MQFRRRKHDIFSKKNNNDSISPRDVTNQRIAVERDIVFVVVVIVVDIVHIGGGACRDCSAGSVVVIIIIVLHGRMSATWSLSCNVAHSVEQATRQ